MDLKFEKTLRIYAHSVLENRGVDMDTTFFETRGVDMNMDTTFRKSWHGHGHGHRIF